MSTSSAALHHGDLPGPEAALLEAVEQELDALADALHDGPVQSLVVARYAADAAVRGGDVTAARDAVQQALVELRHVLWRLRPRGADDLSEALTQLADHLDVPIELQGDATGLPGPAATTAYRLVQALATPGAPGVLVVARREPGRLVLDVSGGRPPQDLAPWRARATAVGGVLRQRLGTLRLTLPLVTVPAAAACQTITSRPKAAL